jgi:gluconate kinase
MGASHGRFELIKQRIEARKGHYMTAQLLESQFAALEPPRDAIVVEVGHEPKELAARLYAELRLTQTRPPRREDTK